MKKLLMIVLAAGVLASCNNAADTAAREKDSLDSIANAKKEVIDSTTEEKKERIDSLAERRDSVANANDTTRTNR